MPPLACDDVPAPEAGPRVCAIDPVHSHAKFRIQYFGVGSVAGSFDHCEGTIRFDPADLSSMHVEARIDANSIDTGNRERDRQLRAPALFDVKTHPYLLFTATEVRAVNGDAFELSGELTVRGITKEVVLEGRYHGLERIGEAPPRHVFTAHATLLRSDYAVRWGSVLEAGGALIGDRVDVSLHIQAAEDESAVQVEKPAAGSTEM